jgi:hypothetical protein
MVEPILSDHQIKTLEPQPIVADVASLRTVLHWPLEVK